MKDDIAVSVQHVSKIFKLPHEKADTIKSIFVNPFNQGRKKVEVQHALRDINFEIKKGEFFGIVGRNGSGKSTLLKIIAGIYKPNQGTSRVNGRLVPFIELGVGFNPELTGRENTYLNGALMGFSEKEVDAKYHAIVDFAELERFMDQKLKNYSSGMQVRLAFSVATILAESDILLIDEVLAVGDADFQRKCFSYFRQLKKNHKTVIFVSHDMDAIREYCDRAVLIDQSKIIAAGTADSVAKEYNKLFLNEDTDSEKSKYTGSGKWGKGGIDITKVTTDKKRYQTSDKVIKISYTVKKTEVFEDELMVGLTIKNEQGQAVCGTNSKIIQYDQSIKFHDNKEITFTWSLPNIFNEGTYIIEPAVDSITSGYLLQWWDNAYHFTVINDQKTPYIVAPEFRLKVS
jgi:ABC-2 type transport system ATP-binding protein